MEIGWWAWVPYQMSSRWSYSPYEPVNFKCLSTNCHFWTEHRFQSYFSCSRAHWPRVIYGIKKAFTKPIGFSWDRLRGCSSALRRSHGLSSLCPISIPSKLGYSAFFQTHPNIKWIWIGDIFHQHPILSQLSAKYSCLNMLKPLLVETPLFVRIPAKYPILLISFHNIPLYPGIQHL